MLDIKTIFVLSFYFNFFCGVGLLIYIKTKTPTSSKIGNGIPTSLFLMSLGVLLVSYRAYLSDFQSIIVANSLFVIGMIIYRINLNRFIRGEDAFDYVDGIIVLLFLGLFLNFTYFDPNVNFRIILFSIVTNYSLAKILYVLTYHKDQELKSESLFMGIYFGAYFIFNILRIIFSFSGDTITDFLQSHGFNNVFAIMTLLLPIVTLIAILAVMNRRSENRLIARSRTDSLTDLYNRMAIMEFGLSEFSRAQRYLESIAVVLIDIDNFKGINDTYGHLFGDCVLQKISSEMEDRLRVSDKIGRYGGDEFLMIVPNIDEFNLKKLLETIRRIVESTQFAFYNKEAKVTICLGACITEREPYNLEKSIGVADAALYEAKNIGRNKTVIYSS